MLNYQKVTTIASAESLHAMNTLSPTKTKFGFYKENSVEPDDEEEVIASADNYMEQKQ